MNPPPRVSSGHDSKHGGLVARRPLILVRGQVSVGLIDPLAVVEDLHALKDCGFGLG